MSHCFVSFNESADAVNLTYKNTLLGWVFLFNPTQSAAVFLWFVEIETNEYIFSAALHDRHPVS